MKKLLLMLFLAYGICACSQKESKPNTDSDSAEQTAAATQEAKAASSKNPFSSEFINAVSSCLPYSEDLLEKMPPKIKEESNELAKALFNKLDLSSLKFIFDIKGMQEGKCQVSIKSEFPPVVQEFKCSLPKEEQDKLASAMVNASFETKEEDSKGPFGSITGMSEVDNVITEIMAQYCQEPEQEELSEDKQKEMLRKMLAFSDKFKNSLKTCTPDTDTIEVMGMKVSEVEIKGKEKGKCHITSKGFHILLEDNELNMSGFDELTALLADEKRAEYKPSIKYDGMLFALNKCEQHRKNNTRGSGYNGGKGTFSMGKHIEITQGLDSSYANDICNIQLFLIMKRNDKSEDHSLVCDVKAQDLAGYITPYSELINKYAPKEPSLEEGISFVMNGGLQTEEISKADKELFVKIYKAGLCKKMN